MKVRVIARHDFAAGFELAGLLVTRVRDELAAQEAVTRIAAEGDVAALLVDERLYRALPRDLLARLDRQGTPVLAPVPEPAWDQPSRAETYILDVLRRAIGYRVRLR